MDIDTKLELLIKLGRALVHEIPPSLRAAAVHLEDRPNETEVCIAFFFNQAISEEDKDALDLASGTVDIKTPKLMTFGPLLFERRDFPDALPEIGIYSFSRDTLLPKQMNRNEMRNYPLHLQARASLYQALLGRIPPPLRAAEINEMNNGLQICFWIDQNATNADCSLLMNAAEQVILDFSELQVDIQIENLPFPKPLPKIHEKVFARKE